MAARNIIVLAHASSFPRFLTIASATLFSFFACSCVDRGYVQREWSITLRELGVVPVFPPREDVYVGDVYAYDFDPESQEIADLLETKYWKLNDKEKAQRMKLGMSPRLTRVDFTAAASDEYAATPSWPQTPDEHADLVSASELTALNALKKKRTEALDAAKAALDAADTKLTDSQNQKREAQLDVDYWTDKKATSTARRDQLRKDLEQARTTRRNEQATLDGIPQQRAADRAAQQAVLDAAESRVRSLNGELADAIAGVQDANKQLSDATQSVTNLDVLIAKLAENKKEAEGKVSTARDAIADLSKAQALFSDLPKGKVLRQPHDVRYDIYDNDHLAKRQNANGEFDPDATGRDLVNSRINRLRLVAFPEFSATTFTEGELSALIPVEAVALGLRANFTNLKSVSVKVPAAESYSVPLMTVQRQIISEGGVNPQLVEAIAIGVAIPLLKERLAELRIKDGCCDTRCLTQAEIELVSTEAAVKIGKIYAKMIFCSDGKTTDLPSDTLKTIIEEILRDKKLALSRPCDAFFEDLNRDANAELRKVCSASPLKPQLRGDIAAAARLQFAGLDSLASTQAAKIYVRVITEVYYARAMDISLVSKSSFGARAEAELVGSSAARDMLGGADRFASPTPFSPQNPQPAGALTKDPFNASGAEIVNRTTAQLGERLKVPGGSVQLVSYNETTIGLRRVFDRPIAIGFRGITLTVDPATGEIERSSPNTGPVPTDVKLENSHF